MASQRPDAVAVRTSIEDTAVSQQRRQLNTQDDSGSEDHIHDQLHEYEGEDGQRPMQDNCENTTVARVLPNNRLNPQIVTPFLSQHIPEQYGSMGLQLQASVRRKDPNTKYCYRHQPDSKCKRTADESTMDDMQKELDLIPAQADREAITAMWSVFSAAPTPIRNLILKGFLSMCCFPQLSLVASTSTSLLKIDFLGALPVEISFKILASLDTVSLCRAAQVSRKWRLLADDDQVWHRMCEQHVNRKCTSCGWGLPILEKAALRNWKREQQLRASAQKAHQLAKLALASAPGQTTDTPNTEASGPTSKRRLSIVEPESKRQCVSRVDTKVETEAPIELPMPLTRRWKDVYRDRFKVSSNWKHMKCSTKVFEGHTNGIICLQLLGNRLATGSYDNTIKLWDVDTGKCLQTFRGHTGGIRALQMDGKKLVSGSIDHTIKYWDLQTGECKATYRDHTDKVVGLHFERHILATASADHTIKIRHFLPTGNKCYTIDGHTDWVNHVRIDLPSRTIFSASDDATVRVWDLDTLELIQVLKHVAHVQTVVFMPEDYEPDEEDEEVEISDDDSIHQTRSPSPYGAPTPEDLSTHWPATNPYAHWDANRSHPPKYVLTASLDSVMRLWCVETGRCLKKYFGHVEGIWGAAADRIRVVSASQDHSAKIWDARTGRCERTIVGHAGPVTCIALGDSRLVTGSEDHTIRMLNFDDEDL